MKKKIFWLVALFAALALVFTACPGGGDDDPNPNPNPGGDPADVNLKEVFSATEELQNKAAVTVSGSDAVFTYRGTSGELWGELVAPETSKWDASAYTGIKFEYKAPSNAAVYIQDDNTIYIFGFNNSDGWAAIPDMTEWTEITLPFSITVFPDDNGKKPWFGEAKPINPGAILKIAFQIQGADTGDKFELRKFQTY
ncbi:MAG: hypothetical protein LBG91_04200 [Treponema sp.]|jgi:hypothetical protein|nr:hypothetical protein [Treponema sp.]